MKQKTMEHVVRGKALRTSHWELPWTCSLNMSFQTVGRRSEERLAIDPSLPRSFSGWHGHLQKLPLTGFHLQDRDALRPPSISISPQASAPTWKDFSPDLANPRPPFVKGKRSFLTTPGPGDLSILWASPAHAGGITCYHLIPNCTMSHWE